MNYNQKGRSMVEMLGVLAIIGILSAGALKGYSAAMFRHKVNQTIDTFSLVLQRLTELREKNLGDDFEITTADDIIKYGLLPECQKDDEYSCRLPIGSLGMETCDGCITKDINIYLYGLASVKECIAFASVGWENAIVDKNVEMNIWNDGDAIFRKTSMETVTAACKQECEENGCSFGILIVPF